MVVSFWVGCVHNAINWYLNRNVYFCVENALTIWRWAWARLNSVNFIQLCRLIFHFWWKANLNKHFHWIKFLFIFSFVAPATSLHAFPMPILFSIFFYSGDIQSSAWHATPWMNVNAGNALEWCRRYGTFAYKCFVCIDFNLLNCQLQEYLMRRKKCYTSSLHLAIARSNVCYTFFTHTHCFPARTVHSPFCS